MPTFLGSVLRSTTGDRDETQDFRGPLFTVEQLDAHARTLGQDQRVGSSHPTIRSLLVRLDESAARLESAYRILSSERRGAEMLGSEEWLRDNFHIAQEQIREIQLDLPHRYYRQLPKLISGPLAGYPRVYSLARELMLHTEGRLDEESLTRFVEAYQSGTSLSIGELWAVPIMIRLVLVEHLAILAADVAAARRDRDRARAWTERLARYADRRGGLERLLARRAFRPERLTPAFVVELLQWLRDQPVSQTGAWHWLRDQLDRKGDTIDDLMRLESQREASGQLAIGNIIKSMRLVSSLDWPAFFEQVSLVERVLRGDPAGAYALMDFPTRDRYRQSIEQLARRSGFEETDIARQALSLASSGPVDAGDRERHVGYYLISRGRARLENAIGYTPWIRERFARLVFRHPAVCYLGSIAFVLALTLGSLMAYAHRHGAPLFYVILAAVVSMLPASELVINIVNRLLTSAIKPRLLPKLSMRDGISAEHRTIVVVPTILSSEARVRSLIEQLEIRFLANRDPHLHFAILSDLPDAPAEDMPEDASLVDMATRGIVALNERYGHECFFLLHRGRKWNDVEHCWMGWERKRGKLSEFNRLLRGAPDTSFRVQIGDLALLSSMKFVITVDSDTELPPDAARRLIGAMAHPLNRPRLDPALRRVVDGYGILQPRIDVSLVSANQSIFARVFSGQVGLDPYTTAASDLYQDLFHEGIYTGKGIYDVDAFEGALSGRVPENSLLSHDLFEGLYARVGLASDVHFTDDYPTHYLTWITRLHRWVRGDWQILPWLWRTVPDASGHRVPNILPVVARWKILDNLRRSLLMPSLLLLLVTGWTVLPGSPALWTTFAVLVITFPAYLGLGVSLTNRTRGVPLIHHLRFEQRELLINLCQGLITIALLVHQALLMTHAVVVTLIRMFMTRRHLLEWESAAEAALRMHADRISMFRQMWLSVAAGIAVLGAVLLVRPESFWWAALIAGAWMAAPEIAFRTSVETSGPASRPTTADQEAFRAIALQTWRFFDEVVGPAHHWLIPDNYQEDRQEVLAPRTSPTNIGLQLLATLAAHDFGYITTTDLLNRLENMFATLEELQRYRGHFYNWYNIETLTPLVPTYVSTVDSGNLAAHLMTTREALQQIVRRGPIIDGRFLAGVDDIAARLERAIERLIAVGGHAYFTARRLKREVAVFRHRLESSPRAPMGWLWTLQEMADRLDVLQELVHHVEDELEEGTRDEQLAEVRLWLELCARTIGERRAELTLLAPWIGHEPRLPKAEGGPALDTVEPIGAPTVAEVIDWCDRLAGSTDLHASSGTGMKEALARARATASGLVEAADRLGRIADRLVDEMDFEFLYDPGRKFFSIGYSVTSGQRDDTHYDTLASEARLASFVAIATGKVPHEHWFKLGRALTPSGSTRVLLSWSGSMFEYLMPCLVMRSYRNTLLDETYEGVVQRQMQYAATRGVPWGISESAYAARDFDLNYQYKAFGVPGLGLKRGLADDLVVAPYACMLAAPIRPREVARNFVRLAAEGARGRFGFYEAIDYTTARSAAGKRSTVVRTFMAHHLGMSLVALDNCLHADVMVDRFHSDPRVQASELLLQERIPHLVPLTNPPVEQVTSIPTGRSVTTPAIRRYTTPHTQEPKGHLLSNGAYTVMVSNAGGGFSTCKSVALTRWREDITSDAWGMFCYVKDLPTGRFWSTTYQPTAVDPDEYEVTFAPDRAVFHRRDGTIELHTEIAVSPEDNVELKRVSITNHGLETRHLAVTSYAEVVLNSQAADLAHPAFQNLFVETLALPDRDGLMCWRRSRTDGERPYLFHMLAGRSRLGGATEYETDRARFVGRGRTPQSPAALITTEPLSNTVGAVLDPIVSLRRRIVLPPGVSARLSFATGFADSEAECRRLADKFHDRRAVARAFTFAGTHNSIELRHLNLSREDADDIQRLAGRLIYGDARLRAGTPPLAERLGQRHLWKHGISGDLPIVLVRVSEVEHLSLFRSVLKAHEYCRHKGYLFDLVVLNEHDTSYQQDLQEQLKRAVEIGSAPQDQPGGVFLRRADLVADDERLLLRSAARAELLGERGSLRDQLQVPVVPFEDPPPFVASVGTISVGEALVAPAPASLPPDLLFFNGLGGFSADGREYAIQVLPGRSTPAPWSNVIANPHFGFTATESHAGHTWSENSQNNRLTPWSNDAVTDPVGEAMFVRDEHTGALWSVTPQPAPDQEPYVVRHGQGYSIYEHSTRGLKTELLLFVPIEDPVKIWRLRLTNATSRPRSVSATIFVEWILGTVRANTKPHIVTTIDDASGALLARNAFREPFAERVAFLDVNRTTRTFTADRTGFLGRNGSLNSPAALGRAFLCGRAGARLDPCGALQVRLDLGPQETQDVIFQLGEGRDLSHARALIERYRDGAATEAALVAVTDRWDELFNAVQVSTPDRALDLMVNRWLPYQTLSCRYWGRSAFYQSGGAYGFRDQLQDVLALLIAAPELARAHIVKAASRQFVEGDVQHWWHEPVGDGARTRSSDDRLWLPYAILQYVSSTGDRSILDESVPFLEGRPLGADEQEAYEHASVSTTSASLHEHAVRAIDRSLDVGAHGLPLIGAGDWNDGLNRVGQHGKGESVWLGWFLHPLLEQFADIAEARDDPERALRYRAHAARLRTALESSWDGQWYKRAYFDDGSPLGSASNDECQIDSIAQSWAVVSGAADAGHARAAMNAVSERLVRSEDRLVLLFTPPFDRSVPDPGYIKSYVPGVRENGGQYTHAALWAVLAFARLRDGDRAGALLSLLNPVNHTSSRESVERYRVEPYVIAADVYSVVPHVGRGGWTWYTGSAGWMSRVVLEEILGLHVAGETLLVDPCIPASWAGYEARLVLSGTEYRITVDNPHQASAGVFRVELDGTNVSGHAIPILRDGRTHLVRFTLGPRDSLAAVR